ncbi:unnamed protein product [Hymenolepis diminuta]|uniref:Uncharacterized protein n=1 Tax=Hymenolepis diminuta TaxID=6216 RepID=A0A564YQP2_HYMDI|nr:unnamed protein product [Hymenolepis diminuta]
MVQTLPVISRLLYQLLFPFTVLLHLKYTCTHVYTPVLVHVTQTASVFSPHVHTDMLVFDLLPPPLSIISLTSSDPHRGLFRYTLAYTTLSALIF